MGKKNNIQTAILIGIFFGVTFGFVLSLIIEIIRDCIVNGFLTTLNSENFNYNWKSSVNILIISISIFFFGTLSLIILCKPKNIEKKESKIETPEEKEIRIRENLKALSVSNDWDSFFLAQENRDYFYETVTGTIKSGMKNYFVDILVEKTLTEIEEKKRIGDKPTIKVYESYISHVEKMESPSDDYFWYVFCWTKNELCKNLIQKMRDSETYEDYVFYSLTYMLVDETYITFRLREDIDTALREENFKHNPFTYGFFDYFSYYTLSKDSWNMLYEAKNIIGLPQVDIIDCTHMRTEYELYENYLYNEEFLYNKEGLEIQFKFDDTENQQSVESKAILSFIEWTEEKKHKLEEEQKRKIEEENKRIEVERKRKIEEENRRIEVERKRRDAELKAPENICKTNIRYSTGGIGVNMNIPRPVCISCGGTGFHEYNDYYGDFKRVFCPDCNGTGYQGGYAGDPSSSPKARCISCGGMGFYLYKNDFGEVERRHCVDCRGTGYMISGWGT